MLFQLSFALVCAFDKSLPNREMEGLKYELGIWEFENLGLGI